MTTIRDAVAGDSDRLATIYNHYVTTAVATFEEQPLTGGEMRTRVEGVQAQFSWLVCEIDGQVVGYAYAAPWKARAAYRHSVETSVYVDAGRHQRGVGKLLYRELLARLKAADVHSVIGGIAGRNEASVRLHEAFGFVHVACLREVGFKFDQWIDVNYYQLLL